MRAVKGRATGNIVQLLEPTPALNDQEVGCCLGSLWGGSLVR
jgi:hypothetical protein